MAADDPEQQAEQLAELLQARGYLVTRDRATETEGIASLLGVEPKTVRNWRTELIAPPSRVHRRIVLYPLIEFVRWRDQQRAGSGVLGEPAAGGDTARRP